MRPAGSSHYRSWENMVQQELRYIHSSLTHEPLSPMFRSATLKTVEVFWNGLELYPKSCWSPARPEPCISKVEPSSCRQGVGGCHNFLLCRGVPPCVDPAEHLDRCTQAVSNLGRGAPPNLGPGLFLRQIGFLSRFILLQSARNSGQRAAEQVARLREGRPLVVVHNAGVAFDLPWFEAPWPAEAARKTLDVNLFGCIRLTSALLPELLATGAGRLVVVSSGAGAANLSKMSEERRQQLMAADEMGIQRMCEEFVKDYEASAREQAEKPLPILSDSGFWLQSYGFSKACLNRWCQVMAEQHSGRLISVACSPGFVETEMVKSYKGDSKLKSVDEGGDLCAWLACSPAVENGYYNPDRTRAS
ncbi:unnamed protein product [Durusdinium trenchii]|uniref:Protochlorophyllide reductase n=1 Tax=Durusdinium trenchii TaxID=1381693 RepID=A0ABP0ICI1_9DINO